MKTMWRNKDTTCLTKVLLKGNLIQSQYVRMATCLFLPPHLPVLFSNKSSMLLLSCECQGPTVSRGL